MQYSVPTVEIASNPIKRRIGGSALKFDETCYHREFAVIRCEAPQRASNVQAHAQQIATLTREKLKVRAEAKVENKVSADNRYRGAMGEIVMDNVY